MLQTFFNSDSGSNRIFERVESETEGRIVVQDFVEELSALFNFEVISSVKGSFIDGAPCVHFFGLAVSARNEDIEGDHIIDCKLLRVNSLFESLFVDYDLVSIDQVLLEFVGKHSF